MAGHHGSLVINPNSSVIWSDRFVLHVAGTENPDEFGFCLLQAVGVRVDQVIREDAIERSNVNSLHGPKALPLEFSDLAFTLSNHLSRGKRR